MSSRPKRGGEEMAPKEQLSTVPKTSFGIHVVGKLKQAATGGSGLRAADRDGSRHLQGLLSNAASD